MDPSRAAPEVREALLELGQYLSDALPPMMGAAAVELLAARPPALAAGEIRTWSVAQYQARNAALPVSDHLLRALEKIRHLVGLGLVPAERVLPFLGALLPLLETVCSGEERERFREQGSRLLSVPDARSSPVATADREAGSGPPPGSREGESPAEGPPAGRSDDVARGVARFELLVARLERSLARDGGRKPSDAFAAQLLATAATASRSGRELEESLARLARLGVDVPPADVLLRRLADSLPGWGVPVNPDADETIGPGGRGSVVGAMRRLVTLSADPAEGEKRFRDVVYAAIEQLNGGNLGRAVTMFGLAEQIIRKQRVEKPVADAIRARAHESLDSARLRALAEKPENHLGLTTVLAFFPALGPGGLLESLRAEKRRDGRRTLLALLEVHGPSARDAALGKLAAVAATPDAESDWYFLRNLLYVLRKVPRSAGPATEAEVEHLVRYSEPNRPTPLVKEALALLGLTGTEKAGHVLVARLAQLEAAAARAGAAAPADLLQLVDRACAALSRHGTPAALRALADHGLRPNGAPGSTARLAHLSSHDLSAQAEVVDRLLKALRAALPVKILGVVVGSTDDADARRLVKALSGTTSPDVRRTFEEVARKYPDRELGRDAAKALAALAEARRAPEPPAPATVAGDLELFGLPNLLHTLGRTLATGVLSLRDGRGTEVGTVSLDVGTIRGATTGRLRGLDALYQILERPAASRFAFIRSEALRPADVHLPSPQPVAGTLLEGMRRYDELQRASALVPDGARFRATSVRPTRLPQEQDPALPGTVWGRALSGATAAGCEAAADADSFRVRRLLVHWVEEGALLVLEE
ncbi:MAG: DUF4388 domain-containing protein [Thermoanaerobaculia bacterium]